MKKFKWFIMITLTLTFVSLLTYALQLIIFKNPHDTFFYLFQDLAFVPISVLLVTVMMDTLLKKREKKALLNKMNMVVSTFFVEIGNHILALLNSFDTQAAKTGQFFASEKNWSNAYITRARQHIKTHPFQPHLGGARLEVLKSYLVTHRNVLMRLLGNPNLLEHESFTDLLWALTHLTDELALRNHLSNLSDNDKAHLAGDISRAYEGLMAQWLEYMKHLRADYPYMFSLAVRHCPFDKHSRAELD